MPGGRPRESIPEKKELIKLGEDLLKWASEKEEGKLRARWCEWYACRHFLLRKQWKRMIDTEEFRPYYEAAQPYLAEKWIDGTINSSIAHRYLRIYDPDLRESEDLDHQEKLDRESKTQNDSTPPLQDTIEKDNEIMRLKHRIAEMEKDANERKTRSELL